MYPPSQIAMRNLTILFIIVFFAQAVHGQDKPAGLKLHAIAFGLHGNLFSPGQNTLDGFKPSEAGFSFNGHFTFALKKTFNIH